MIINTQDANSFAVSSCIKNRSGSPDKVIICFSNCFQDQIKHDEVRESEQTKSLSNSCIEICNYDTGFIFN
jgi:hypothetical protein